MNEKSRQIDSMLNMPLDYDQPLSPARINAAIRSALPIGQCRQRTLTIGNTKYGFVEFSFSTEKHAFLSAAVTFLGGNGKHPIFKKRIQLKSWFKPAYRELSSNGYLVHFFGVYHYEGNFVFVDFGTETYMKRKMHNSSAFVYVNDLFRAMKDGVATRIDLHGNRITTIRKNALLGYLSGNRQPVSDARLFSIFDAFNHCMTFMDWIKGESAITEMQRANWSKWRETEWPGWYLEYKFATFLAQYKVVEVVYQGNESKKQGELDFDLIFPLHKFYGDLKASDIKKKDSPGNDKDNLFEAIDKFDRFWYVIYEHDTIKDKDCGNSVTKFRYNFLISLHDPTAKSPLSYAGRMKNRVNFRRMMILELNRANCGELLSLFNQGHQPSGEARAQKVLINKRNVENYQVFHYEA